jgi:hypothetical protein
LCLRLLWGFPGFNLKNYLYIPRWHFWLGGTGTCFIQKIYAPSSSLLQGKHLPFTPSPLRLNIFHLFVILSPTQLYRYTPEIFLFSTSTFKYKYRAPLRRIGQEYSEKVAFSIFQSLKRIQPLLLFYIWEEMIMMALLHMAGLENFEFIWKIQRKPEVVVSVSVTEK